jgi:hypothetical protein
MEKNSGKFLRAKSRSFFAFKSQKISKALDDISNSLSVDYSLLLSVLRHRFTLSEWLRWPVRPNSTPITPMHTNDCSRVVMACDSSYQLLRSTKCLLMGSARRGSNPLLSIISFTCFQQVVHTAFFRFIHFLLRYQIGVSIPP